MDARFFWLIVLLFSASARASTTVNPLNRQAYGANVGWIDWRGDTTNGARVGEYGCSGYVYAANVGWISLGDGTPANGIRYQNSSAGDFGVNHDGTGNLFGLGWSANAGWLTFTNLDARGAAYGGPKIDLTTGRLSGWVYGANIGWISLDSGVAFVQTDSIDAGADTDHDGLPDAWEMSRAGNLTTLNGIGDDDNDGVSNADEYLADTDPFVQSSVLRITSASLGTNGILNLTWASRPTRMYRLLQSTDLESGARWESVPGFGPIRGDPGPCTCRVFKPASSRGSFYRIQVLRDALEDTVNTGIDPCLVNGVLAPKLTPDVATDGQVVYLTPRPRIGIADGSRARLTGYRYNVNPPSVDVDSPQEQGRECIYCGCVGVNSETNVVVEGAPVKRYFMVVPMDAPSGDYTVTIVPPGVECPVGGIGCTNCPTQTCVQPRLYVRPAYLVTTLNWMQIDGNAEDSDDHPAEMSFSFTGFSGTPMAESNPQNPTEQRFVAPIMYSGRYPGGPSDSGYLTTADGYTVYPGLPLFVGAEHLMIQDECLEESISFPQSREAGIRNFCNDPNALHSNSKFEFVFAGIEDDPEVSDWWGYAAGIVATAASCYLGAQVGHPCTELANLDPAVGVGGYVADYVNQALHGIFGDDNLGQVWQEYRYNPFTSFHWDNNAAGEEVHPLSGDGIKGDIKIAVQTHRVGGPRVLQWRVTVKSIHIQEGYEDEEFGCHEPNEVFLNARASLYTGQREMEATKHFPVVAPYYWPIHTHDTAVFDNSSPLAAAPEWGETFRVEGTTSNMREALESPFIYVEFAVWEDDEDLTKDLLGLHSATIFLADFVSGTLGGVVVDEPWQQDGSTLVRRVTLPQCVYANGFAGSDTDCSSGAKAQNWNAKRGNVCINYEVEVTWLKQASR